MSIERAKTLLASSDTTDNRNGAALVINAGASSANVPEILSQGIINLLLPKLRSTDLDLVMKTCWAINNLCVHELQSLMSTEQSRDAIYKAGVLEYMPSVLRSTDPEVLKKAAWALTNISRNPAAQKDVVRHGTFKALINLLTTPNDEVRGAVLQPLCNLVLDAENQNEFFRNGGIGPVVRLLQSHDERTKELAVTLISFVTTNHDSIRDALVSEGVLRTLGYLVEGAGTLKMQEYAINALVNISLSDSAEAEIAEQGVLTPVTGLLSSSVPKLRQQAAMLLSNLLTNKRAREKIRYIGWVDPVLDLLHSDDAGLLQQILRVIINITFDGHCRSLLVKRGAEQAVNDTSKRSSDPTVHSLATTALKNLSVPVATDIQSEVEDALRSGRALNRIAPPEARKAAAQDALAGLDDLVGDISRGKRDHTVHSAGSATVASRPAPAPIRATATVSVSPAKPARDPLDDLLTDLPPPRSQPSARPAHDPLDDLLSDLPPARVSTTYSAPPPPKASTQSAALDDLDDILNDIPRKSVVKAQATDELDDLLAGIDTPKSHNNGGLDDLDDLLSGMDNTHNSSARAELDDIDALLGAPQPQSTGGRSTIDDILLGIDTNSARGLDAIDDLLADLSG